MQNSQKVPTIGSLIQAVDAVIMELDTFRNKVNALKNELVKSQSDLTPEEEFKQKYPDIQVESEYFNLVGCMSGIPEEFTDKDVLIEAIKMKC